MTVRVRASCCNLVGYMPYMLKILNTDQLIRVTDTKYTFYKLYVDWVSVCRQYHSNCIITQK